MMFSQGRPPAVATPTACLTRRSSPSAVVSAEVEKSPSAATGSIVLGRGSRPLRENAVIAP